ncbi:hypothetical protein [Candidatus Thiosymbion oneisti]|uniref:hypothetical protein n=1 Tax=Candidatus Thiosymbion oneisti TaxID=589554 RepID=UPI001060959B|nr:hypothetical protein [Candidatus Thiosymbion oneisti]
MAQAQKGGGVKVFVASFTDSVKPEWSERGVLVATKLTSNDDRWNSVKEALAKAAREKARIVVFPELTLPHTLRMRLCRWLADEHPDHPFLLVLAGSFHVKRKQGLQRSTVAR